MALALYRKYRPQAFKDITNQNHIKITLEGEITSKKVAHAYLFSGPRGTGKTSIARIFAKAVNCEKRKEDKGEPCNACAACEEITSGRALDVLEIDAASHTGVDNVRETIVETVKFAPTRLRYKVFIIDEAHMLSTSAWNALLKVMEEPPSHVIFILATTESHKVPATILSRCQRFNFHRVKARDMVERLKFIASQEKVKIATPVLESVARLSEGCVRDAESLLEQLFSLREKDITEDVASLILPRSSLPMVCDLFEAIHSGAAARGLMLISKAVEEGIDLQQWSQDILELLRKVLLIRVSGVETVQEQVDGAILERIRHFADVMSTERILGLIDIFVEAKQQLKNSAIPQLPLEVAVVEGCGVVGGEARAGGAISQLQGSSSAPPSILGQKGKIEARAADAPNAARPHHPRVPLVGEMKKSSASATLLPQAATADQTKDEKEGKNRREGFQQDPRTPAATVRFSSGPSSAPSLDIIKEKWPEVLKQVQQENHSLPLLLSTSEVMSAEGDTLHIGVQYPFHRDKLNEVKPRGVLEKIVAEIYGMPLKVLGVVRQVTQQPSEAVDDILSTLGGRVVE